MDLFSMTSDSLAELEQSRSAGTISDALCPPGQVPLPATPSKPLHISSLSSSHSYLPALTEGLANLSRHPVLILGVQSDILFPYEQQKELAEALRRNGNKQVSYYELDSPYGHDTFLIDLQNVGGAIRGFLTSR
jgi:homoserine acetyltransferase